MDVSRQRNAKVIGELMRSDQLNVKEVERKRPAEPAKTKKTKAVPKAKKVNGEKLKKREVTVNYILEYGFLWKKN